MARKKKKKRKKKKGDDFELSPETKRGIMIVFLFTAAILIYLSFFDFAGALGGWINTVFSYVFGWDKFLFPLLMLLIGGTLMYPERGKFSAWNYAGMVFFFLSFNGLLNLVTLNNAQAGAEQLQAAGGYLGQILAVLLPAIIGYWGSLIIIIGLMLVSVMLMFNTSLRNVLGAHHHITGRFGAILHRLGLAKQETDEWGDPLEPEERRTPEKGSKAIQAEEADEKETKKTFTAKPVASNKSKQSKSAKNSGITSGNADDDDSEALTTSQNRDVTIPIDVLDHRSSHAQAGDIDRNKRIIQNTFQQFNIDVEMGETSVGPTVTQFTLRPAKGVKLSKIVSLQNDLALALAAHPIRIEAPIPGKSLVGLEVPNQSVAMVALRELLESKSFKKRSSNLTVGLGKDVAGKTWSVALDKMPHVLVAGATGSGKSVCLNAMIVSLLYQNGPDQLKLIMVDPKRVELNVYEGIPHLLIPPITETDDTVNALKWTVREMERRLEKISKFGARNIDSYNKRAEEKMPKIVVIIDELADVMQASGNEMESAIVRIAQMARATGIHLVLATQRPSVDVITGLIKANVPSRIAFSVASQTDSRTILDVSGAEKLLGRGDMLFSSADLSKPKRLQGAYVSEDEVRRIVDHLKEEEEPEYNHDITDSPRGGTVFEDVDEDEPLLEDAIEVLVTAGKGSTSLLQRKLRIGYSRAARIIDILHEQGIVGPSRGSKARKMLIDEWPLPDAEEDESGEEEGEDGQPEEQAEDEARDEQQNEYTEE
jgi:S-DNA-T family DNA segregation ATPase FtsK/SpoIIIE